MNTKRTTAMRHRRLGYRKSEKEKEQNLVIEAAVYAAAMATADAIRHHDEEVIEKYPRIYFARQSLHEAFLKVKGTSFENILADRIRREMHSKLEYTTGECKLTKMDLANIVPEVEEGFQLFLSHHLVPQRKETSIPHMSKAELMALSDRMYNVSLEEMQEELYDDAE